MGRQKISAKLGVFIGEVVKHQYEFFGNINILIGSDGLTPSIWNILPNTAHAMSCCLTIPCPRLPIRRFFIYLLAGSDLATPFIYLPFFL